MPKYGMNLDPDNPKGFPRLPAPGQNRFEELRGMKWVRFVFQAEPHQPRSIAQSCEFYDPIVNELNAAGIRTLFILNHQTFVGDTPWLSGNWQTYEQTFSAVCGQVAGHFKGRKAAYEIWNEGDQASDSAIFVDPVLFAPVLKAAFDAIKAADSNATVVFGGLVSGDPLKYLQAVQTTLHGQMPVDAIGVHPYGKGPTADNSIITHLGAVTNAFPNHPVWITELGDGAIIPDRYDTLAFYIRQVDKVLRNELPARVPVLIWYCWSDGMNPQFGITDQNLDKKGQVYDAFVEVVGLNADADEPEVASPDITAPSTSFTHQDLINAVFKASEAAGGNVWQWFRSAGLNFLFTDRQKIYDGITIDALPGLTAKQKDLTKRALAKQPLRAALLLEPGTAEPGGSDGNPVTRKNILEVMWVSQMDKEGKGNNDCGDASVLMLLRYYDLTTPARAEVFSRFEGKTDHNDLIALANDFMLTLASEAASIDRLPELINQDKPVILLVNYSDLMFPVHLNSGVDQGHHWFVVVGYTDDAFYVHDPLWLPTQRDGMGGAFLQIQRETLRNALIQPSIMLYKAD